MYGGPSAPGWPVSRGSFYWHFADLAAFHQAVLKRWREVAAAAVIQQIEGLGPDEDRLRSLLRRAFAANAALEVGVRAWAASDVAVRAVVEAVDKQRLGYIETLLKAAGVRPPRARVRAQVLYWTYLGAAFSGRRIAGRQLALLVEELAALGRGGETISANGRAAGTLSFAARPRGRSSG